MNKELLSELKKITPEEERLLSGSQEIEKTLYMSSDADIVDCKKLLEAGRMIQVRPHTRFVHFPKHTHNYIEVIYMCAGTTHHIINGNDVILEQGELLFLSQTAVQEIYPAKEGDIAVNFIVLPEFFQYGLTMMEPEENQLKDFIVDCLRGKNQASGYLHFKVADVLPVQNLVENLIWTVWNRQPGRRRTNQATMGLLFLQLMNCMDRLETDEQAGEQKLVIDVLSYIEANYRDGELQKLADSLHYDVYWLSREISRRTGKTYTELMQAKRLSQAAYLLASTGMNVLDVAQTVGYDNISYFHRIFKQRYGMTPRHYRLSAK
jgi:AraC-like DNA-binding protein